MSRLLRRLLVVALGPGLVAELAAAEPSGFELAWEAPEGCPQAPAIRARVRELTGPGVDRPLSANGVVVRAEKGYELTLAIRDGCGVRLQRLRCDTVMTRTTQPSSLDLDAPRTHEDDCRSRAAEPRAAMAPAGSACQRATV